MRLLISWLRDFVDVRASAGDIALGLALRGFEVASVEGHGDDAHGQRHHDHDRPVVVQQPNVVYAPPVVVEAPQEASSGFNITIPVNFR